MDWSHFGMTRPAFRPAADPASYFPAATHEAALAGLSAAFARRDPAVLIDGPPGTGKTLAARRWLARLAAGVPRAVLPNVHAGRAADLLQAILFDLDRPYQGLTEQELRLAVTAELLAGAASGYPTVLVIDEAQHLGDAAIEELRLLGNVETPGGSAVFAVLVGQPGLRDRLRRPEAGAFAQRVGAWCGLDPLTAEESAEYLRHRVLAAGGRPGVLDEEAAGLLAGACGGVPRVLNRAATAAAELAAEAGADTIDAEAAVEALARLGLGAEEPAGTVPLPEAEAKGKGGRAARPRAGRKRSA